LVDMPCLLGSLAVEVNERTRRAAVSIASWLKPIGFLLARGRALALLLVWTWR
jgi:hypothetical protein